MSNTPVETNENDFVLKHRIAGAAFLLFFGALVLPWLLGPPTEAKKTPVAQVDAVEPIDSNISEELESEILAELQGEVEEDVHVFISKVTPDGKVTQLITPKEVTKADSKKSESKEAKKQQDDKKVGTVSKIEPVTPAVSSVSDDEDKLRAEIALKEKQLKAKKEQELAEQRRKAAAKAEKDALAKKEALAKKAALAKSDAQEKDKSTAAADLAAALAAESASVKQTITSGWVVQVGMFVDKKKAQKVFDQLSGKGFTPSTSVVDTNLGAKTGTRVWLGPFAERDEAVSEKAELSKKTGSSGFIRAYP